MRLMTPTGRLASVGACPGTPAASKFDVGPMCAPTLARGHTGCLKTSGRRWMTSVWALAALWLGLALIASLISIWLRISTALSEIVVGTIAQLLIGAAIGSAVLGTDESWVKFLSGIGAIVLTFLAGAELDPAVFKRKWKEATAIGLVSFFFPFIGCAAAAYYVLGWEVMPSWLAGVALSTTSVAVVYAVMIEFGFNTTDYGKTVLAA